MKHLTETKKIEKDIASGIVKPIYFLSGVEHYYMDRLTDFIAKNLLSEEEKGFNQHLFYGRDSDPETIINCAKRLPMMSEYSLVIVKEAQHLSKALPKFEAYFTKPNPHTILVFNYKEKTLDKRTKIYKALKQNAVLLETKKLYESEMPNWILAIVSEQKRRISIKGAQMLTSAIGNNLSRCMNEIKKLFVIVPQNDEIKEDHIEEHIGISKEFNIFELQNAIGKKDTTKAFKIAHYFSQNPKEHPLILTVNLLNSFFSKIFMYHGLRNRSPQNIASTLEIHPYFVGEYNLAARHYNMRKIAKILSELRKLDLQCKGVGAPVGSGKNLLKTFLFNVFS